jgi:exopolysaccharide biosynthesis polyprenyl glycosylphosphotransferase
MGAGSSFPSGIWGRPLGVGRSNMSSSVLSTGGQVRLAPGTATWTREYLRRTAISDFAVATICSTVALQVRFDWRLGIGYVLCSVIVPLLWVMTLSLSGAYNVRCIGTGSEEFRKVLNAGFGLTAGLAIISYAINAELSREYLLLTMPTLVAADLCVRYAWRKRLHRRRATGQCMSSVLAVGPESAVVDLVTELRRGSYHGLTVVAACVRETTSELVAGVPVFGGLGVDDVVAAVRRSGADTVAVLSSSELDGATLRQIAWGLEKTGTELCVAPALLDVAGPRTTIRPIAGLTLLHVDHPRLSGPRQVLKDLFDRCAAGMALVLLSPLMLMLAFAIKLSDGGPALFTQTRVGKDGSPFKIYKFRTMVVDAEKRLVELREKNEFDGVLFKIRHDPRVTAIGMRLRKWSLDELPQLFNVLLGEMSLVGPRPALPDEAAVYADHVRRRLVVKPGLTGMWQVSGRSDLTWDESVRLDLRYVENWSLALDLQILWKTFAVLLHGSGAY